MMTGLLHTASRLTAPDPRSDAHLVAAFLTGADQGAFAELVRRHGPTVFGVCRRLLGATPDAEDAFQATFLVLVRRAHGTEWRESLGPWLYGVALRVARKARAARAKRFAHERQVPAMSPPTTSSAEANDAAAIVDEELAALPAKYRLPLVLCEIQGASRHAAARELGLAEGTLSSRLARGRKLLRDRLARRGFAPAGGLAVAVPAALAQATVRHAVYALARTAGAVPAGVLFLTEEVTKTMIVNGKLALTLVTACVALTGFGAWRTSAQPASTSPPTVAAAPGREKEPERPTEPQTRDRVNAADGAERVATIFGDVPVTREQFANHLIRRYGKKELELFVNKQIIATAFGRKGWVIRADDVLATLDEDCKAIKVSRDQFVRDILPRYGKTLEEWTEDVIVPRLMMMQLLERKSPAVTEAELRQEFESRYSEGVWCRVATWSKDEGEAARKASTEVAGNPAAFERYRGRETGPMVLAPRVVSPVANEIEIVGSKLPAVNAVSSLVVTDSGYALLKCFRITPAEKGGSFEGDKARMLERINRIRLEREIPKLFNELKRQANPQYHLALPTPAAKPNPVPAKK